jgi:hypothetical protein
MKDNGLNFGEYHHGRDIVQGNACREFLEKRAKIFDGIQSYVFGLPEEQQHEVDGIITAPVFELHLRLTGHSDALISYLSTKRFHLDRNGPKKQQAEKHRDRFLN